MIVLTRRLDGGQVDKLYSFLQVLMLAIILAFMARGIEDQDLDVIETQPLYELNEKIQVSSCYLFGHQKWDAQRFEQTF